MILRPIIEQTELTTPLDKTQRSIVARITTAGVVTEFSHGLSSKMGPRGIATGPDGNLWFTDYNAPGYGRITTNGTFTTFRNGLQSNSYLYDIKPGPGGTLWVTELVSNRIGKLVL